MKIKRATELLNVELSRISAALGIAAATVADLPAGEAKTILTRSIEEAKRGQAAAFEHIRTISVHAGMI